MIKFKFLQREKDFKTDPVTGFTNVFVEREQTFNNYSSFISWLLKTNLRLVPNKEEAISYEIVFVSVGEYEEILINKYDDLQEFLELTSCGKIRE